MLSGQFDYQFTLSDYFLKSEREEASIATARKVTNPALN